ncbi:hypothetical protein LguiA_022312 [Lonicera macranthoides]
MSDYLLPSELWIEEILTRLPVKTLLRCTSVCKSWYSLITSPNFITLHLNRTTSNKNTRLLVRNYNDIDHYSVHADDETFDKCEKLNFTLRSRNRYFNVIGTCNGLVCLSDDAGGYYDIMILWNPSIRKSVDLPYPNVRFQSHGPFQHTLGFGFNPVTNDYNVVRVVYLQKDGPGWGHKFPPEVELYELSTGSWRNVSAGDFSYVIQEQTPQVVLNSIVHWAGHTRKKGHNLVVSFDLKNETFGVMRVPPKAKKEWNVRVMLFGESLSLIDERISTNQCYCYIWVMKEYGVENSWTRQFKIDTTPGRHLREYHGPLRGPYGFRKNGDVLLTIDRGRLVSYNPKSRKLKKLGIRGCVRSFYINTYMESLVLLKRKDEALGMQENFSYAIHHRGESLSPKKRKKSGN